MLVSVTLPPAAHFCPSYFFSFFLRFLFRLSIHPPLYLSLSLLPSRIWLGSHRTRAEHTVAVRFVSFFRELIVSCFLIPVENLRGCAHCWHTVTVAKQNHCKRKSAQPYLFPKHPSPSFDSSRSIHLWLAMFQFPPP